MKTTIDYIIRSVKLTFDKFFGKEKEEVFVPIKKKVVKRKTKQPVKTSKKKTTK